MLGFKSSKESIVLGTCRLNIISIAKRIFCKGGCSHLVLGNMVATLCGKIRLYPALVVESRRQGYKLNMNGDSRKSAEKKN